MRQQKTDGAEAADNYMEDHFDEASETLVPRAEDCPLR